MMLFSQRIRVLPWSLSNKVLIAHKGLSMEDKCKTEWVMAPFMVETAYQYYRASQLLWSQCFKVSIVNAALSIEILLKSFNAAVVANEGALNEKYKFNEKVLPDKTNKHDLVELFDALPADVKNKFSNSFVQDMLEKYRYTFIHDRYMYEPSARSGATTSLIDIAGELIKKTVAIYVARECTDPWIQNYPNV